MQEEKRKRSAMMPIIGLVTAVVIGGIAWVIAPNVLDLLRQAVPSLRNSGLPLSTLYLVFAVMIFVLTLVIFGLVAALITAKDDQSASEFKLEKERDDLRRRQKAERLQRRKR